MKIEFIPVSIEASFTDIPKPAKSFVPQWYKDIEQPHLKKIKFDQSGLISNPNLKMCSPFLDSLTHGYIAKTWCDIYIERDNNLINYYYSSSPEIIKVRKDLNYPALDLNLFYEIEFAWQMQWMPKTPFGYSILITHPLNRMDLPFYTLSGIIDSDKFYHQGPGNLPFFIKKDFKGIIPAGTPMYQITPIKREKWESREIKFDELKNKKMSMERFQNFIGVYKNKWWVKKEFS